MTINNLEIPYLISMGLFSLIVLCSQFHKKDSDEFACGMAFSLGMITQSVAFDQLDGYLYYLADLFVSIMIFAFIINNLKPSFTILCIALSCILSVLINAVGCLMWALYFDPDAYNYACWALYGFVCYALIAGAFKRRNSQKRYMADSSDSCGDSENDRNSFALETRAV